MAFAAETLESVPARAMIVVTSPATLPVKRIMST